MPTISILSVMIILRKSWHVLSNKTFTNCFKTADILEKEVERVLMTRMIPSSGFDNIEEDTVQTLGADLHVLKEKNCAQVDLSITPDEFIDFDIEVPTTNGRLSNQEILADINDDQVEVSDNEGQKC